jgi:Fe-Mn family superoxide dismutase
MHARSMSRRGFLRMLGAGSAAALVAACTPQANVPDMLLAPAMESSDVLTGAFTLPPLPYAYNALEPYIDEQTMRIHHDRHHQGYVDKLNAAVANYPEWQGHTVVDLLVNLEALPDDIRTTVRRNGGGHINHTLFWNIMTPNGGGQPTGALGSAIQRDFGSFDTMKQRVTEAALNQFGSGWAWLTLDQDGNLHVSNTANQNSPYADKMLPLLGIDVWEHAYYLKYQNRRAEYVNAWWNTVNWDAISARFMAAV